MNRTVILLIMLPFSVGTQSMRGEDAPNPQAPIAPAADPADVFEACQYRNSRGEILNYRLLEPLDAASAAKYPLVVFLHGAGERGDDNKLQLFHGCRDLAADAMRRRHPAFVVVPQCPADKRWVEVAWDAPSHTMPTAMSDSLRLTIELVCCLEKELPIDPCRRYGVGLSMGGYGVWDILQRRPGFLAAAVPVCAGGDPAYAACFAGTPVWAFHGDADTTVPVNRSREMIAALRAVGGQPIYTEYEGVGHNSWTDTFANRAVWDWLFAQRQR
jgi:predicted peptidase